MSHPSIDDFCAQVCERVRFHPDHRAITAELAAHLEDHMDALMERGVPGEEAARQAVAAMGDPEEIGRELDKSHSPRLGWFQIWFRVTVWITAALIAFAATAALYQAGPPRHISVIEAEWAQSRHASLGEFLLADLQPEAVYHGAHYTFSVERVLVEATRDPDARDVLCLLHVTWRDPWLAPPELQRYLRAEDDLGRVFPSSLNYDGPYSTPPISVRPYTRGPLSAVFTVRVDDVGAAAKELTLTADYFGADELSLTVPLREEDSHG